MSRRPRRAGRAGGGLRARPRMLAVLHRRSPAAGRWSGRRAPALRAASSKWSRVLRVARMEPAAASMEIARVLRPGCLRRAVERADVRSTGWARFSRRPPALPFGTTAARSTCHRGRRSNAPSSPLCSGRCRAPVLSCSVWRAPTARSSFAPRRSSARRVPGGGRHRLDHQGPTTSASSDARPVGAGCVRRRGARTHPGRRHPVATVRPDVAPAHRRESRCPAGALADVLANAPSDPMTPNGSPRRRSGSTAGSRGAGPSAWGSPLLGKRRV